MKSPSGPPDSEDQPHISAGRDGLEPKASATCDGIVCRQLSDSWTSVYVRGASPGRSTVKVCVRVENGSHAAPRCSSSAFPSSHHAGGSYAAWADAG